MKQDRPQFNYASLLAIVMSQVGCLSIVLVGAALGAGLLINQFLGTQIFTVLFILGSFPVVIYLTMRVVMRAQEKIASAQDTEEESDT